MKKLWRVMGGSFTFLVIPVHCGKRWWERQVFTRAVLSAGRT